MREQVGVASEAYTPEGSNRIIDEEVVGKYLDRGYSIGYEVDEQDQPVPTGGNTAIFRISPGGLTEPVFVTKPQEEAEFRVRVLGGVGKVIVTQAEGEVSQVDLFEGVEYVIRPGDAYSYINTDSSEDLVLHDVATPAFEDGDDVELTSSIWPFPEELEKPGEGFSACVYKDPDGELRSVDLANEFYEAATSSSESYSDETTISFEEVFGFTSPTAEQVDAAAEDLQHKFSGSGAPVGMLALFSIPGAQELAMDLITAMAERGEGEEEEPDSMSLVYYGFITAIEMMAALHLRGDG